MITIYKEEIEFQEELSINNLRNFIKKSPRVDEVYQTKKSINFNLNRFIGNKGVLRLLWTKISVIAKQNKKKGNEYKLLYKLDGVSLFMLIILIGGIIVEFTMFDSGIQKRDLSPYAIPLIGFSYLSLTIIEFVRVKKAVNEIFKTYN